MSKFGVIAGFLTKDLLGLVFVTSLIVSPLVIAEPATAADGWYVSGNVGATILRDADITDDFTVLGVPVTGKGKSDFDTGYGLSGAIGHAWGPFRLEGEISYRKNDLDKLTVDSVAVAGLLFTGVGTFDLGGDISSFGFMANGYYDFQTGSKWVPFLMAGIGGARLNLDVTSVGGLATTYDESDTVFAYQVGAGVGYKFTPNTTGNLQYRYFGTSDPTFNDGVDKVEGEYQSHNVLVGITIGF